MITCAECGEPIDVATDVQRVVRRWRDHAWVHAACTKPRVGRAETLSSGWSECTLV